MPTWLALISFASAVEPCPAGMQRTDDTQPTCCWPGQTWDGQACAGIPKCPSGMRATPWGCHEGEAAPRPRVVATEKRLVLFSGYGGQTLFLDGDEVGRLPTSLEIPLGEHEWHVVNVLGAEEARGPLKVRRGEGNQIVVLEKAPVPENLAPHGPPDDYRP